MTGRAYDPADVSSIEFWSANSDEREATFAQLRRERPVSWHPPAEGSPLPDFGADRPSFWAVVRHADVVTVSRRPDLFCSGQGVLLADVPQEFLDATLSFLGMDDPRHFSLRRLVSSAFTPRRMAAIEDQIRAQARQIVDDFVSLPPGDYDFVTEVSARLPMWTISEMIGVDPADRVDVARSASGIVDAADPSVNNGRPVFDMIAESIIDLHTRAHAMAQDRRSNPRDDLMTALVEAEVEGERLADDEIAAFFVLLAVAGNDTSRNTISLGMKALNDHPDQRSLLLADLPGRIDTAVEEIFRWASPVLAFRRTATQDVELNGRSITAGDKLVMFYPSANRDESVFENAHRFDVTRDPNPHVSFGGGGPHYCLGASLARTQVKAVFAELLTRVPHLEVGEPRHRIGNLVYSIGALPCRI
ncbi:MAG: cytochrome P450 [Acidimicrobiia bacterium]